ncbi:MAG TPA: DUF3971 domain-containing protein [Xanthobacteraceae bacterium]|nr:DUF3971 domain-containing protein [Xanthobacteraceae bacterium]
MAKRCETRAAGGWLRRIGRVFGWSCLGTAGLAAVGALALYSLFATGVVGFDLFRPYVERALEGRLGGGHTVAIGSISSGTDSAGDWQFRVNDVAVRDAGGEVVASAPSAEITLQSGLMPWSVRPQRIDLVGAELTVHIDAQGAVMVATGRDAKLLPAPAARLGEGADSSLPPDPGAPAPAAAVPVPDPLVLSALAVFADTLDRGGFDGGALAELGLKNGTLHVESEVGGRRWTFGNIGLHLNRPAGGGMRLRLESGGTDGPWSAAGTIGPLNGGARFIAVEVRDLAPRDVLLAAGKADQKLIADSPLSADLRLRIDAAGRLLDAAGEVRAGAGNLQIGTDPAGRMVIDEASIGLRLDPAARRLMLDPIVIHSGPLDASLALDVGVPAAASGVWPVRVAGGAVALSGGGADGEKEPPLRFSRLALQGRFDAAAGRFVLEPGEAAAGPVSVKLQGELDLGAPDPFLALTVSGSPMSATSLKRLWPILAAPDVRRWVLDNVVAGDVKRAEIFFRAPLDSIGSKDRPLPDEGLRIEVLGTKGAVRAVPGLPPIRDADVSVLATGRTAHVVASNGTLDTPDGRKLSLPESVFDVPDTAPLNPDGKVRVRVEGNAAAALELQGLPALRGQAAATIDPASVKGTISGLAQVNLKLKQKMTAADIDYAFEADLTGLSVDKLVKGQRLDGANVKMLATPAALVLRGDGKLAGAPMNFEARRPHDSRDMEFRVAINLDDAARTRVSMDLPGLSGTVGAKLAGRTSERETKADVELDLGAARLAELVPGWSKPAGKPAKLTAKATMRPDGARLDDLVVTGAGVSIRGSMELDSGGGLVSANLPTFQLSDGDKAGVKIERADGVAKIQVRGEVIEARAFLKSLMEAPLAGKKGEKPADIDLDINLGTVAGNNGEVMKDVVLVMSRRNGDLRALTLAAKLGRNGGVNGGLKARDNGRPELQIVTSDAGALLRFVDLYARVQGGQLWMNVDAPQGDGAAQDGTINMRDFVIRGEPGLDRLLAAAPAAERGADGQRAAGAVAFTKLQVDFRRSAGELAIREGAIWGPAIGSTFDGSLDFANDRAAIRGTYVPAYGLNNLFSRLPVLGFFLGGGPNEGLVGVTFEIAGPLSGPTLRVNPISAVAPGFLRKIFEFRQAPDPKPPEWRPPERIGGGSDR